MAEGNPGPQPLEDEEDHPYFKAVEVIFLDLRGSPLTVGPADWHVAQRWHRQGMPLEVVRRGMELFFERRKERGAKGKVSSLRYVAPAVEALWAELRELAAPGEREEGAEVDLAARLHALAAALPSELPGRDELAARIAALEGDSETVEAALAGLDAEMLQAAEGGLSEEDRAEIAGAVECTVAAALAGRLEAAEIDRARARLEHQVLRQRLALPVLSLFSPEAQPDRP